MATSGTTTFNLDLAEIIEEAFERASGGAREVRSGYDFKTARRSLSLMLLEWSNRGLNLWTVEEGMIPLFQGQPTYGLPEDTVDLVDHVIRENNTDLTATRISVADYAAIPNKMHEGRPIQVYIDRQIEPRVTVWPVPSSDNYSLVYWRLRRIEDAGGGVNTQDVPFRFLPCLISGLAYYLSQKLPEGLPLREMLKAQYDADWALASTEDRDKVASRFTPVMY